MESKICPGCKKELPLSAFYKDRNRKDGHTFYCGNCVKEHVLIKYKNDPRYRAKVIERANKHKKEYYLKSMKNWRKNNRDSVNEIARTRYFLATHGLRQTLWERAKEKCEKCGQLIRRVPKYSNYAIHHIDGNRKNNSIQNLLVVCTRCHLHSLH